MIKSAVSTMFVCAMLATSTQLSAAEAGVVKTVQGQVEIERADAVLAVKVGDVVFEGDRLRVRGDGRAGVSLKDETLLSVGPNSSLTITTFAYDPTTREGRVETSLLRGTMRFVTGLIGRLNPAAVKVDTPTATIGIRGTDFIVEVSDEK